jgi:multidrug resistance efflux pump
MTEEPTRADLEAALGCARATIDGLREQVAQLEAEREQLHAEIETGSEADR